MGARPCTRSDLCSRDFDRSIGQNIRLIDCPVAAIWTIFVIVDFGNKVPPAHSTETAPLVAASGHAASTSMLAVEIKVKDHTYVMWLLPPACSYRVPQSPHAVSCPRLTIAAIRRRLSRDSSRHGDPERWSYVPHTRQKKLVQAGSTRAPDVEEQNPHRLSPWHGCALLHSSGVASIASAICRNDSGRLRNTQRASGQSRETVVQGLCRKPLSPARHS